MTYFKYNIHNKNKIKIKKIFFLTKQTLINQ